ncbi:MAG: 2-succinyl-5-enolpyruvyl-6-hydroxy-3-cyclohexene-1-carboxylic-acid synthase [Bacteroidetes bacterium MedPE-SWsnd-G2]|nr:MAG: 2-succinyl-5-enolpyruvyl-6-hydroxy-3-cyclohexene-1-carboxylic-acid synthase [Bacteroidetes bacterium MedPE-SWsnd-G2]
MKYPNIPLAQAVVQHCKIKNIRHIVISPGSRNAPLTIGFTEDSFFDCYSIVDERCAGFFALGIAQQQKYPVVLVCTSGSALLNYYPAIAEAYFSEIPLIVLSADRPEHLINIGDGQTIFQDNVYGNHILFSGNLNNEAQSERDDILNQAINSAVEKFGPVHVNVPFNEPLYNITEELLVEPQIIQPRDKGSLSLDYFSEEDILTWQSSSKKMVLLGVNTPDKLKEECIQLLANDPTVVVFTETTSNIYEEHFFPSIDKMIAPMDDDEFKALQPEILLTFGGLVISKKIKGFLRAYAPNVHWNIGEHRANDTFFKLSKSLYSDVNTSIKQLYSNSKGLSARFQSDLLKLKAHRELQHKAYLESIPYSDLKVFGALFKSIPEQSVLHLGNSSTVRYAQLFNFKEGLEVYCNRGTSGIDGSTSTAIGFASASKKQTICISGDLSFIYDSNALWNNYIPNNFRVIVINNGGGGIFRILPGHKNTEEFDTYFETKHNLNASHLCHMYGFEYQSASTMKDVSDQLKTFYKPDASPKLLEIFTPDRINDEILLNYFKALK